MVNNLRFSTFKGSVAVRNSFITNKTIDTKQKYQWKFLDEKILGFFEGITFTSYHYMHSSINAKIKQLTTSGFIEHWIQRWTKHRYIVEKPPPPGPKVLTLDDLQIGFQIWLLVLGAAFIAFICELILYWLPKLCHLYLFHEILKGFYKLRAKSPHFIKDIPIAVETCDT